MQRLVVLAIACSLLSACSTRALHPAEDLWDGYASADGAAFLGYHDRLEQVAGSPKD